MTFALKHTCWYKKANNIFRFSKNSSERSASTSGTEVGKVRNPGSSQNRRGPVKCFKCNKVGHTSKNCFVKVPTSESKFSSTYLSLVSNSKNLLIIDIPVCGVATQVLIDTGASCNLVSEKFVDSVSSVVYEIFSQKVHTGKAKLNALVQTILVIDIGGVKEEVHALVVPECLFSVILGFNFFQDRDAIVDFKNKRIKFQNFAPVADVSSFIGAKSYSILGDTVYGSSSLKQPGPGPGSGRKQPEMPHVTGWQVSGKNKTCPTQLIAFRTSIDLLLFF